MAEQRLQLLKKRLLKDGELLMKYRRTMQEYIVKGHAQRVQREDLDVRDRPVWYLPHHPVTNLLKPGKVRVVFDCGAKYHGTSLNQQLLQGPDLMNPLVERRSDFAKNLLLRQPPLRLCSIKFTLSLKTVMHSYGGPLVT